MERLVGALRILTATDGMAFFADRDLLVVLARWNVLSLKWLVKPNPDKEGRGDFKEVRWIKEIGCIHSSRTNDLFNFCNWVYILMAQLAVKSLKCPPQHRQLNKIGPSIKQTATASIRTGTSHILLYSCAAPQRLHVRL